MARLTLPLFSFVSNIRAAEKGSRMLSREGLYDDLEPLFVEVVGVGQTQTNAG